jgi:AraC-like DNA-binding protein
MESGLFEPDVQERVIPTENVQLMFHYKEPFLVCHPNTIAARQPRSIISGLNNSFSDVSTFGEAGVVFVSFYPSGACHFFDFPLFEIENRSIDLGDIFCSEVRQVEEHLQTKSSTNERIKVIEDFLLKRFSPVADYDSKLVDAGIRFIKQSRGQLSSATLSEKLSVTTKNLERKFSEYIGKTPKQFIRLIRFQATLADLGSTQQISFTEHAYRNGYFDQAHFIKEFKSFTGFTPREFHLRYPDFNLDGESC